MDLPLADSEALVVLGSLNAREYDRRHTRDQIKPVQVVRKSVDPVDAFQECGDLGVSSMAWLPGDRRWMFACDGRTVWKIDLHCATSTVVSVPNLADVHEMTVIGSSLWLANTGRDEVVEMDAESGAVRQRIPLEPFRSTSSETLAEDEKAEDTFHCNQVFEGTDGDPWALVHHISGQQMLRRIASRLVKKQEDGGIINLRTGETVPLGLRAPHTARRVYGEWWVFDSLAYTLRVFDSRWRPLRELRTSGLGRGAAWSEELRLYYAGISETRRRYLGIVEDRKSAGKNMVEVFSPGHSTALDRLELEYIEQVNNVYLVPRDVAAVLMNLSPLRTHA